MRAKCGEYDEGGPIVLFTPGEVSMDGKRGMLRVYIGANRSLLGPVGQATKDI